MGSPGDFQNANTGPLPRREVKSMKFKYPSVVAVYLSSNGLDNQALSSPNSGIGFPLVAMKGIIGYVS